MGHLRIGNELNIKFDFYITGLIFTLLGLSVQTAVKSSQSSNVLELTSWILLLLSGLLSIQRLEWTPVVHHYFGTSQLHENSNPKAAFQFREKGNILQDKLKCGFKFRKWFFLAGLSLLILARAIRFVSA